MKFLLIQLKNLLKLLAHLDAGNQHVVKKCVHAFFIHRIYNRIQKLMSDQIKTLICWRKRGDWWIIFTLPLANILVILIHYYVIFLHYRAMEHAKYTLVILCRTGQEYEQKWCIWSLISFPIFKHEFFRGESPPEFCSNLQKT